MGYNLRLPNPWLEINKPQARWLPDRRWDGIFQPERFLADIEELPLFLRKPSREYLAACRKDDDDDPV